MDARPTLASPDDDPHLWLEDVEGAAALAWVEAQNAKTLARFALPAFAADRDALVSIFSRPDNIPHVSRRGAHLHNFWKDEKNPRGLWRRTSLASYRGERPEWDVLLDLDALAEQEGEDWIWSGATTLPKSHDRAILRLSRGGSDAVVLREFDLHTRAFVEGGFCLAEAKSSAAWLDQDHLLLSSAFGSGMATDSGYARTVRLWRRGERVEDASTLFETTQDNMAAFAYKDLTQKDETIWFGDRPGFFDERCWVGDRTGPKTRLDLPTDTELGVFGDWLAVKRRTDWTIGGKLYPAGALFGGSLPALLRGAHDFEVLFEPAPRKALQYFFWARGRLILSILDDLRPVFEALTPAADGWSRETIEGISQIGVASIGPLDSEVAESDGTLLATFEDPLSPSSLLLIEPLKSPALLKRAPRNFSPEGLRVTRHEAVSVDGEKIPYFQVGPERETGDAPVHLTGYGGFAVPILPYHNATIGKLWLERGGVSVTACLRGGGEFGDTWHEAGRREKKRLSHDDFAAVAADLVRRGVTRPERIAAEGGSNGGILISNMLTRYPERFGALLCTIPLIDMRRYSKLLAGASWIAEYGDPDVDADWAFLQNYSAYHMAEPGRRYPPILLATTRKDDRVHPGHARKMAAKLQAMGYEAWFYEPAAGGHGYGKDHKERAAFTALGFAFLRERTGWSDDADASAPS